MQDNNSCRYHRRIDAIGEPGGQLLRTIARKILGPGDMSSESIRG